MHHKLDESILNLAFHPMYCASVLIAALNDNTLVLLVLSVLKYQGS